jgi:hypothetical protein
MIRLDCVVWLHSTGMIFDAFEEDDAPAALAKCTERVAGIE